MNKNFFLALSTLIGMIVGVGFFGIPYVSAQAGFSAGLFYLVLLTGAILLLHLCYGEIVLRTKKDHGLVGFADRYLNRAGKIVVSVVIVFEFYGALLAYIIAGGKFLNTSFGPVFGGNELFWAFIFFAAGSLVILLGIKTIASAELFMAGFLIFIAAIFIYNSLPIIKTVNLSGLNAANFFLPYGVILFSLTGGAAIPEVRQILAGQERKFKKVIIVGTILSAAVYALFALSVVGVSGIATSQDAISGLASYFGGWAVFLGAIFGFLAVFTSYLVLGSNLKRIFHCDWRINRLLSWVLVCFIPFGAYLSGFNNFIVIIGLVGAVAGGLEGILIVLIYWRAKKRGDRRPEYSLKLPRIFFWALIALFALGAVYGFTYLAK